MKPEPFFFSLATLSAWFVLGGTSLLSVACGNSLRADEAGSGPDPGEFRPRSTESPNRLQWTVAVRPQLTVVDSIIVRVVVTNRSLRAAGLTLGEAPEVAVVVLYDLKGVVGTWDLKKSDLNVLTVIRRADCGESCLELSFDLCRLYGKKLPKGTYHLSVRVPSRAMVYHGDEGGRGDTPQLESFPFELSEVGDVVPPKGLWLRRDKFQILPSARDGKQSGVASVVVRGAANVNIGELVLVEVPLDQQRFGDYGGKVLLSSTRLMRWHPTAGWYNLEPDYSKPLTLPGAKSVRKPLSADGDINAYVAADRIKEDGIFALVCKVEFKATSTAKSHTAEVVSQPFRFEGGCVEKP